MDTADQKQIEDVKKWLKQNGPSMVAGVVLGVVGIFGWDYYQGSVAEHKQNASIAYEKMLRQTGASQVTLLPLADLLVKDYSDTPYAAAGQLLLAKSAVEANQLEKAEGYLQWAIDKASQDEVVQEAKLRLARVFIAQQKFDQALAVLTAPQSKAYVAAFEALKGDAYLMQNQFDQAKTAYEAALDANLPAVVNVSGIQMKLDNLPALRVLRTQTAKSDEAEVSTEASEKTDAEPVTATSEQEKG
ncbi:YfgM family protein [Pelagibaculum spongiae]|uniref:Ancillary SecYEG translocon subunit n=1 Tax=Pelagibaculum spongiae TaxID=2080658 RepID=A0A2V1GZ37_9GAMM|nr:tetratricopeptide repeat protein [Pelagibaculum spongiae]PVZ72331.1 hypothetical protein DC094_04810 [Pelagibaculum spongiae]